MSDHLGLSSEQAALLGLVREVAAREIAPHAVQWEHDSIFPREAFTALGKAGLLGLTYPEQYGGGEQPFFVYLLADRPFPSAEAYEDFAMHEDGIGMARTFFAGLAPHQRRAGHRADRGWAFEPRPAGATQCRPRGPRSVAAGAVDGRP